MESQYPAAAEAVSRWIKTQQLRAGATLPSSQVLAPNAQDWRPGNERIHSPHAHYATVFDAADPAMYERTIYSLEWSDPRPEDAVEFIEAVVDPKAGPSLALVAVTALLEGG